MLILSELWIYPIKSMGGISRSEAHAQLRGLQYDRRWMLTDETGRFLSQREIPELALLGTAIEDTYLRVFWKKNPAEHIRIPLQFPEGSLPETTTTIWDDTCRAQVLPTGVNDWFSMQLKQKVQLVYMPDSTRREADPQYAPEGQHVSFADGFPFLIIGQASLDELNRQLAEPLPMNRFRPNFVFTGGTAHEEDEWSDFQIGNVHFRGVKRCARCAIPTIDQDSAERTAEPLKTLATYRNMNKKILFGQNVILTGEEAVVRVGDGLGFRACSGI
jgi:uncharacterized protein